MARPMGKRHQDDVRSKIQADRLLTWLQAGIFGTKFQGKDVDLSPAKVNAARALLNKRLPDLSSITHAGDPDKPIQTNLSVEFVKPR